MFLASGIEKSFGARKLFGPADIKIEPRDRLALAGSNGSGKTTLLKILAGLEHPDAGEIVLKKGLCLGYLPQESDIDTAETLIGFVLNMDSEIKRVGDELKELSARVNGGEQDETLIARLGFLEERYNHLGGYRLSSDASKILVGLGFKESDFARPLMSFSGGWRMRALLAQILLKNPDFILLDEPTNHLDIVTLEWLEGFVKESRAAFLIVSHDVSFLNRIVTGVVAIEDGDVIRIPGNWTSYIEERESRYQRALATYERFMRKRSEELKFVERFRAKNTKATLVQSRIKRMEKEEEPPPPKTPPNRRPAMNFKQPERSGKDVIVVSDATAGYGEKIVFTGMEFSLHRGEKVVLIGPNGAGKSTLMKLLMGALEPKTGKVTLGLNVTISYFSQHQMEILNPSRTVLEEVLAVPGVRLEGEARSILGSFLFSGDDVDKKVSVLSGGEKSRLVLAKIMAQPGNLLLFDEPTNHLDVDACEVLKAALQGFTGTMAVITHDRDLINRIATRVAYVDGGQITSYIGNYDDYLRAKTVEQSVSGYSLAEEWEEQQSKTPVKGKEARRLQAERRERFKALTGGLRQRTSMLENKITEREHRKNEIHGLLADPTVYNDPKRAGELGRELKEISKELDFLNVEWEESLTELMEMEEKFKAEEEAEGGR